MINPEFAQNDRALMFMCQVFPGKYLIKLFNPYFFKMSGLPVFGEPLLPEMPHGSPVASFRFAAMIQKVFSGFLPSDKHRRHF
jgi:hypothetical protein